MSAAPDHLVAGSLLLHSPATDFTSPGPTVENLEDFRVQPPHSNMVATIPPSTIKMSWQNYVFAVSAILTIVLVPGGLVFIPYLKGHSARHAMVAGQFPVAQHQSLSENLELRACNIEPEVFNGTGVHNKLSRPPGENIVRHRLLVCFYEASEYDPYGVARMPLHLCTHLVYGSYGLNGTGLVSKQPNMDRGNGLTALVRLTGSTLPVLPVLVTIGGRESDAKHFSTVSGKSETRKQFAQKVYDWTFSQNLKGINIDWRYPGGPCGSHEDKKNVLPLVVTLRTTARPNNLLALSIPPEESLIERGFELQRLLPLLDFLFVMTHTRSYTTLPHIDCPGLRRLEVATLLMRTGLTSSDKVCYSVSLAGAAFRSKGHRVGASYEQLGWPSAADGRNMSHGVGYVTLTQHCRTNGWTSQKPADPECSVLYRNVTGGSYDVIAHAAPDDFARRLEKTYAEHDLGHTCLAVFHVFHDDPAGHCGNGPWPLLRTLA
ncbi:uncharacterized protein LOC135393575 [Ornithodoros turicata]|uniref:uncharacterized protein LOC135393575 n=1 Tax=Ornithodoros turicata TaxID=34597 RepID=UPI00313A4139